jgi:membrane-associated phospholipid phosphatase
MAETATDHASVTAGERRGPNDELSSWSDALLVGVAVGYAVLIGFLTFIRGVNVTPDVLLVAAGFGFVILARSRLNLLREWTPFLVLFLAYELMRGLADDVGFRVHVSDVASLERRLFAGHLPTALLQGWFHPASGVDWLAVAGTVVYMLHFVLPLATALLLWRLRPNLFHPYLVSLILLSFAGFVTYLFLPVAPPWLAAQQGLAGSASGEPVISYLKPGAFADLVGLIGLDGHRLYDVAFTSLNANPVAAFPSLHAAYPFLTFLVLRRAFGRVAWWAFAYFAFVAITVVYTADHYLIDVMGGVIYASAAYGLMWWLARRRWREVRLRPLSGGNADAQQPGQQVAEEEAGHAGEGPQDQDLRA